MKLSYKGCDVTITAVWSVPSRKLTPIVEIKCKDTEEQQIILTTSNSFVSAAMAEHWGEDMAREWIDGHFK